MKRTLFAAHCTHRSQPAFAADLPAGPPRRRPPPTFQSRRRFITGAAVYVGRQRRWVVVQPVEPALTYSVTGRRLPDSPLATVASPPAGKSVPIFKVANGCSESRAMPTICPTRGASAPRRILAAQAPPHTHIHS